MDSRQVGHKNRKFYRNNKARSSSIASEAMAVGTKHQYPITDGTLMTSGVTAPYSTK
jgi:hypothetical protein